ncbi:MAG TPA: RES family NAD+ phosphorylase [Hanamia sp.]|nr:RES family NAD+ phosphorylase [Hanamia sp.]
MIVYRISIAKYSTKLIASGFPARWNSKDIKVIYTAESKALACLENVVHRNSRGLQKNFRQMDIAIPAELEMEEIRETDLNVGWKDFLQMPYTQSLGDAWVSAAKTPVLKVPSAIVSGDSNYLINPSHKDFRKIKLIKTIPFEFDSRIKM